MSLWVISCFSQTTLCFGNSNSNFRSLWEHLTNFLLDSCTIPLNFDLYNGRCTCRKFTSLCLVDDWFIHLAIHYVSNDAENNTNNN